MKINPYNEIQITGRFLLTPIKLNKALRGLIPFTLF